MLQPIKVNYKYTANVVEANKWLQEIAKYPTIACDFEASKRYSDKELAHFKELADDCEIPKLERMEARAKVNAKALDHPSHVVLTHLSIAWSESDGAVFILDNPSMLRRILTYLVTTSQLQIWHNASFDFKHIYYHTGKFPINFEDTQIYTKTLLNHVEVHKAKSGLKDIAGIAYGAWGISKETFHFSQMYEPRMLLYAATDSCATLWIWHRLLENVEHKTLEE